MPNNYKRIQPEELLHHAYTYCDNCIESTLEKATASGRVVLISSRHIPTVNYFLHHWLRRERFDFYTRGHWYAAMKDEDHPLSDTIKRIDELFNALALDIVANEGKGIFYAKNKLGMTDRIYSDHVEQPLFLELREE